MIVVKAFCMSLCAGCMKELNFRELLSSLNDIVFMTKAVCKYNIAALVNKLCSCVVALIAFRKVCFLEDL